MLSGALMSRLRRRDINTMLLYLLKERIRMGRVEDLVCPHHGHKVLRFGQVDNVVRIAGQHMNRLNMIAADLKLDHFVRPDFPLLNQPVTSNHDKEFPLSVVPMLAFRDAGLGYID